MNFFNIITLNTHVLYIIIAVIVGVILIRLNDLIFNKLDNKKNKIHIKFFRRVVRGIIIILAIVFAITGFKGLDNIYGLLFRSSILLTALLGIIGKDILQDLLAGLMISIYHPFNLKDRVILSDIDKPCVVEDMTMRHVVLKTMDNICYIIPNSLINEKIILNSSFNHSNLRGTFMKFEVAYDTDVRLAIHIIREVVKYCPYTLPNNEKNKDLDGYGDVYFMGFNESSLLLETTIWTENETDNFLAASEVRIAVIEEFKKNNIEIPYPYFNIIKKDLHSVKKDAAHSLTADNGRLRDASDIGKRNVKIKTDKIIITNYDDDINICFEKVDNFVSYFSVSNKNSVKIRLIVEELYIFTRDLFNKPDCEFWISGNSNYVKIHYLIKNTLIDYSITKSLKELSAENDMTMEFTDKIKYSVYSSLKNIEKNMNYHEIWRFNDDTTNTNNKDLEKILLLELCDDIHINTKNKDVHIIAEKIL
ncbi:MAG: mechanosensitive ion channel family protein [Lachnospiraceae bacterium]|nr:mechanosensitive ion channel family protein [Lachnospiraceae bacterium]